MLDAGQPHSDHLVTALGVEARSPCSVPAPPGPANAWLDAALSGSSGRSCLVRPSLTEPGYERAIPVSAVRGVSARPAKTGGSPCVESAGPANGPCASWNP